MKDLRAVLDAKEADFRRISNEVAALRIAMKLCDVPDDKPPEVPADTPKEVKGWP